MNDGYYLPYDELSTELRSRSDVEGVFDIEDGVISTPGKFEREAVYVPYFWDKGLDGWADEEPTETSYLFYVTPEDVEQFPELRGRRSVTLNVREDGFVYEVTSKTTL